MHLIIVPIKVTVRSLSKQMRIVFSHRVHMALLYLCLHLYPSPAKKKNNTKGSSVPFSLGSTFTC